MQFLTRQIRFSNALGAIRHIKVLSSLPSFLYCHGKYKVTDEMRSTFNQNGYAIVRNILDHEEISKLNDALETDGGIMQHAYFVNDGRGRRSKLCIWKHPGHDITGMVARSEKLLGGEVYHYHTKLMMKEAFTGGSFVWHQDYGYWYMNGCLYPDMGTAFIAIDRCDEENGCLQVVRGSNHLGRLDHGRVGGQTGANADRVAEILKELHVDDAVLDPGDALFFHCNLLHKSNRNDSARRRWAFLIAYNRASNNPTVEHHCPRYTPLEKVEDVEVRRSSNYSDMTGKDFMDPSTDRTADGKK
ncbi:L-proline trans-4-hydroxylase-like isoform X2 [Corticium candelabrum]|uniref:L-proline trans-4-hydroxylase-like isoform X2 n=1 Tax=Corticium candelabrum TaxID=121492 RepID=UPI002E2762A9|nr:L-proline trans-4-hydroxylase-like isoform X2 [Corticium candelabrum]